MLTVAIPKRNKLQNIIVLTPKDGIYDKTIHNSLRLFLYQFRISDDIITCLCRHAPPADAHGLILYFLASLVQTGAL